MKLHCKNQRSESFCPCLFAYVLLSVVDTIAAFVLAPTTATGLLSLLSNYRIRPCDRNSYCDVSSLQHRCAERSKFVTCKAVEQGTKGLDEVLAGMGFAPANADGTPKTFHFGPRPLTDEQQLKFERQGHLAVRALFRPDEIKRLKENIMTVYKELELKALRQKVSVFYGEAAAREPVDDSNRASQTDVDGVEAALDSTSGKEKEKQRLLDLLYALPPEDIPFLQLFNLFRTPDISSDALPHQEVIRQFVTNKWLGKMASELLGCRAVRVYQDSIFVKRPGDGATNWHSDLNMAPFDSNDFVTFWIPLNDILDPSEGGSCLVFADRSHKDFALTYWGDPHDRGIDLSSRYDESHHGAMQVGDVTVHHGWTLHSAPGNDLQETRIAYTISYVGSDATILDTVHTTTDGDDNVTTIHGNSHTPDSEDAWSFADWLPSQEPGKPLTDHPYLPIVYDAGRGKDKRRTTGRGEGGGVLRLKRRGSLTRRVSDE